MAVPGLNFCCLLHLRPTSERWSQNRLALSMSSVTRMPTIEPFSSGSAACPSTTSWKSGTKRWSSGKAETPRALVRRADGGLPQFRASDRLSSRGPESGTMRSRARRSQERPAGRPAAAAASSDLHHARREREVRRALRRAFAGGGSARGEIVTHGGRLPPRPPCTDRTTRPRHGEVDVPRAAGGAEQVLLPPPGPQPDRAATSARA